MVQIAAPISCFIKLPLSQSLLTRGYNLSTLETEAGELQILYTHQEFKTR